MNTNPHLPFAAICISAGFAIMFTNDGLCFSFAYALEFSLSCKFLTAFCSVASMTSKVALAQMEYQLPRLTRMWSHLERQAGGKVKGMGEKQIEVDKRILRTQVCYATIISSSFVPGLGKKCLSFKLV